MPCEMLGRPSTVWGCRLGQGVWARVCFPVVVASYLPMAVGVERLTGTWSSRVGEAL